MVSLSPWLAAVRTKIRDRSRAGDGRAGGVVLVGVGGGPIFAANHTSRGWPSFAWFAKLGTTGVRATDFLSPNRGVEAAGNIPGGIG